VLRIGYEASGPAGAFPIILLHGFPDDVRAFDGVVPPLVRAGYRALVPYLRGYGPTRFRDAASPRMAEQAAIGQDVIDFADALRLPRFAVAGYDWGGRAAAIAAALHPERVRATVLIGGYTIQNTVIASPPGPPEAEYRAWYQWYFNTDRGRAGLQANRRALCRLLWQLWSPSWHFTDEEFDRTAASFDNPDIVDAVIHSYRHRYANAPGEPRFRGHGGAAGAAPEDSGAVDHDVRFGRRRGPTCSRGVGSRAERLRVVDCTPRHLGRRTLHAARAAEAVSSALLDVIEASR
jgi:pimeloyl-ACP methyl ester carboxylesterase